MAIDSNHHWLIEKFPQPVMYPKQYDGEEHLSFYCTQTNLTPAAQKKLVQEWCRFLPSVPAQTVSFTTCLPQALFEAICRIPNLQRLWVKWSRVSDIAALSACTNITHIYLGDSVKLTTIEPLLQLPQLVALELHGLKRLKDFDSLSKLTRLESLVFAGAFTAEQPLRIPSYRFFASLNNLCSLSLDATYAEDGSLQPLHALTHLKHLFVPNYYSLEEFAVLHCHLRHGTECRFFAPYVDYSDACNRCGTKMVMLIGARQPFICPECRQRDFVKHCAEYDRLFSRGK